MPTKRASPLPFIPRHSTDAAAPTSSSMRPGEIATNSSTGEIYVKTDSALVAVSGGSGGDSSDKLPLAGGTMTGAIMFGTGSQNINVGSFDNSTGGSSGISLVCAVGYELNWQGGHLSSTLNAGSLNYAIVFDSSLTLASGKRLTFSDGTYLESKLPVIVDGGSGDGALPTDAAVSDIVRVIYNGNGSVQNPSNPVDGKTIRWMLTQDGTGSRIITLDTKFHLPTSHVGVLPWSTAANATDLLAATYCASRDQWDVIAFVPGY